METNSSATVAAISDQSNKENIPPVCNNTKGKKNPIPHMAPSFKNKKGGNKRKPKRIPLADITNLFNNTATFTLPHQQQDGPSALPSSSNSRRRAPGSKTLRMGFR